MKFSIKYLCLALNIGFSAYFGIGQEFERASFFIGWAILTQLWINNDRS